MIDIKQDVKAFVKAFVQVFVSVLVKELTKKMLKNHKVLRWLLEIRTNKMSDDQLVEYLDKNSYFKKTLEKIIKSIYDFPSAKGTGSLIAKLESIFETTSFLNNPINALILPAPKVIIAVAASTAVVTTAAIIITLPSANFISNVTEGNAPLSVQFTDLSKNATLWYWDFGDGGYSSDRNPVHTYYAAGDYTVKLEVSIDNRTDSKSDKIKVLPPVPVPVLPVANFSSNVSKSYAPLSVQFTDLSKNATVWYWDFGDGGHSSEKDPVHTYYAAGDYTVKLKASNGNGTDSTAIPITVLEKAFTIANFSTNTTEGDIPLSVQFTDLSQNTLLRSWDFGDGTYSKEQNPEHTYLVAGNYNVNLTVTNANGKDSKLATIYVLKLTPAITWSNPADIVYGTELSTTQSNATATSVNGVQLDGTFVYNPAARTVLSTGTHILHAEFTPGDVTNYNNASNNVTINVTKATPTISLNNLTDISYGTALNITPLNVVATHPVTGNNVTGTFVYTPAPGTVLSAGIHTLHVDFIPEDAINYTNASKTSEITVLNAAADVAISSFSINSEAPTTADQITFTAVVKNQGNTASSASKVSIKVGGESQASAPRYDVPALAPGDTYIVNRTLNLNVAQNYIAIATADPDEQVVEDNESNNQATIYFTVVEAARDLTISSFSFNPTSPTTADQMTFTAVVQNKGNAASGPSTVSIKVGGESQASAPRYDVPSLAPGAAYTVTRTLGGFRPIAFMANATADPDGNIAESDENNNLASITFIVTQAFPDLAISSFSINPAPPTTSDQITFTAVVKNHGNAASSASKVSIRVGGEYPPSAPRYDVPALAPGDTYIVTRTLNLNVAQNYIANANADPEESIIESNESNNQANVTFTVKKVTYSEISNISI